MTHVSSRGREAFGRGDPDLDLDRHGQTLPRLAMTALAIILIYIFAFPLPLRAGSYTLPQSGDSLIGEINYFPTSGETPTGIAQRFDVGLNAIIAANPGTTEKKFAENNFAKIPSQFLLPEMPHKGIIINLAEMRLYYFPDDGSVMTYPVGIGKVGKTIPITTTFVWKKVVNPVWVPTVSEHKWNKEVQGITLPKKMPPGPDNPLGPYAIYLGLPTYMIHSTIFPESIGRRGSFGCIRMNELDIKDFFPLVDPKTPVTIVYLPTKFGWNNDKFYAEIHPPLEDHGKISKDVVVQTVAKSLSKDQVTLIDWETISYLADKPDGVPHEVGFKVQ